MKSRKAVFQLIASRYGLGYAEINNTSKICLSSAYLPNHPEVPYAKMPSVPGISMLEHDPLYHVQLGVSEVHSCSITYLYSFSPTDELSKEQEDKITQEMDAKFQQLESKKEDGQKEEKQNPIFSNYQVGIKKPIRNNKVLEGSGLGQKGSGDSQYSIILDFSSSSHLQRFLGGVPEESRRIAAPGIYAVYECTFGPGCYQILVPHGAEHKAVALLLGKNQYVEELPVTQYILDYLQPKEFLSSFFTSSLSDEQYSAALGIIQKCIATKGNVSLTDFDEPTRKIIESNRGLKQSFLSTVEFFKKNNSIVGLLDGVFPKPITDIVMAYNTSQSKCR